MQIAWILSPLSGPLRKIERLLRNHNALLSQLQKTQEGPLISIASTLNEFLKQLRGSSLLSDEGCFTAHRQIMPRRSWLGSGFWILGSGFLGLSGHVLTVTGTVIVMYVCYFSIYHFSESDNCRPIGLFIPRAWQKYLQSTNHANSSKGCHSARCHSMAPVQVPFTESIGTFFTYTGPYVYQIKCITLSLIQVISVHSALYSAQQHCFPKCIQHDSVFLITFQVSHHRSTRVLENNVLGVYNCSYDLS